MQSGGSYYRYGVLLCTICVLSVYSLCALCVLLNLLISNYLCTGREGGREGGWVAGREGDIVCWILCTTGASILCVDESCLPIKASSHTRVPKGTAVTLDMKSSRFQDHLWRSKTHGKVSADSDHDALYMFVCCCILMYTHVLSCILMCMMWQVEVWQCLRSFISPLRLGSKLFSPLAGQDLEGSLWVFSPLARREGSLQVLQVQNRVILRPQGVRKRMESLYVVSTDMCWYCVLLCTLMCSCCVLVVYSDVFITHSTHPVHTYSDVFLHDTDQSFPAAGPPATGPVTKKQEPQPYLTLLHKAVQAGAHYFPPNPPCCCPPRSCMHLWSFTWSFMMCSDLSPSHSSSQRSITEYALVECLPSWKKSFSSLGGWGILKEMMPTFTLTCSAQLDWSINQIQGCPQCSMPLSWNFIR